jgi:hypothetical protein
VVNNVRVMRCCTDWLTAVGAIWLLSGDFQMDAKDRLTIYAGVGIV